MAFYTGSTTGIGSTRRKRQPAPAPSGGYPGRVTGATAQPAAPSGPSPSSIWANTVANPAPLGVIAEILAGYQGSGRATRRQYEKVARKALPLLAPDAPQPRLNLRAPLGEQTLATVDVNRPRSQREINVAPSLSQMLNQPRYEGTGRAHGKQVLLHELVHTQQPTIPKNMTTQAWNSFARPALEGGAEAYGARLSQKLFGQSFEPPTPAYAQWAAEAEARGPAWLRRYQFDHRRGVYP